VENPRDGRGPPLRRQKTILAQSHENFWIEHDKSDLSSLDDVVSLRSFKAKDREKRRFVGVGDMSLYAVEDERQGFDFGGDDFGGHSSDSSLDLHTSSACRKLHSTFQHHRDYVKHLAPSYATCGSSLAP